MDVSRSSFLHFELSGTACALPIAKVREVLPMASLTRPPRISSVLEGFLDIGGIATPVVRLAQLLGLSDFVPTSSSHLIWLREESSPLLFLVERVHAVFSIGNDESLSLKSHQTFNGCVVAQVQRGGATLHLLSVEKLLLAQERKAIDEFTLVSQKRVVGAGSVGS